MARKLHAYEHGDVKDVPLALPDGPIRAMWQRIWDLLQGLPRITPDDLEGELVKELPMAVQRVIAKRIILFSGDPRDRDPELRRAYRGKLLPFRPLSESAAVALTTSTYGDIRHAFDEEVLAKRSGLDPEETASLVFWLVYKRVMKRKDRETAAMFPRSVRIVGSHRYPL